MSAVEPIVVSLTVNGVTESVETAPHRTLLETLREDLLLTGTKEGCGTGDCGACTVIVDGEMVSSCLMLIGQAAGRDVLTVEGLSSGTDLHPVQEAFANFGAVQCGFCIPGAIMAAVALLKENPTPTRDEIRWGIAGNLCRCTGYTKMVDAIESAAAAMSSAAVR